MKVIYLAQNFQIQSRHNDADLIWPLLRALVTNQVKVILLAQKSLSGREYIQRDGIEIFYLNQNHPAPQSSDFIPKVKEFLMQSHQDSPVSLVHSLDETIRYLSHERKVLGFKTILDVEALELSKLFSILSFNQQTASSLFMVGIKSIFHFLTTYFSRDRDILSYSDAILVTSPQQRFFLERYYMYPDSRIFNVPRAFDLEFGEEGQSLVGEMQSDQNLITKYIVNTTDMTQSQETKQLLKAFERLAVKNSSCHLIIIGMGPAYKEIEFYLYSLALGNRATLLGDLNPQAVSEWVKKAYIFVDMSSMYRQFESYVIEAMLRGKVVIASELGPLAHIIESGQDGFLVRPADATGLQNLFSLLLANQAVTEKLARRASEKALAVFAPGRAADVVFKVYQTTQLRDSRK